MITIYLGRWEARRVFFLRGGGGKLSFYPSNTLDRTLGCLVQIISDFTSGRQVNSCAALWVDLTIIRKEKTNHSNK